MSHTRSENLCSECHSHYLPPSPPTSATTSSNSSPHPQNHSQKDHIFYLPQRPRRTASSKLHARPAWVHDSQTDSSGSGTETKQGPALPPRPSHRRVARRATERASTLPTSRSSASELLTSMSSPKPARPLSRRSSHRSPSSSSSSPSLGWGAAPSSSTAGIGRKVAASLDLFKETTCGAPTGEEADSLEHPRPLSSASKRKPGPSHTIKDVAEAQFEFVKRSDWPGREAAALKREKSTTGLERVRTRDSTSSVSARDQDVRRPKKRTVSIRDTVLNDLVQWRRAVEQDSDRGRPRERSVFVEDSLNDAAFGSPGTDSSVSSTVTYYHEHASSPVRLHTFPPSPSPSCSPVDRSSSHPVDVSQPIPGPFVDHEVSPPQVSPQDRLRSPTPIQANPPIPLSVPTVYPSTVFSDITTHSPWSTDDESTWDTASITTTSTTSASSPFPLSPSRTSPLPQPIVRHASDEDEEQQQRALLSPYDDIEIGSVGVGNGSHNDLALGFNLSQESLPHIPLRPFRNQVGGHSAIYKFTKRAVCKPLVSRENLFYEAVEREAPPLLDFIPRYLGVMLVSYRRVPRGSNTSSLSPHLDRARPPLHVSMSDSSRYATQLSTSHPQAIAPVEEEEADAEAELPEVALDYNRHIVPQWLLRGTRGRAMSHSDASAMFPRPVDRPLRRPHLNGYTASSPDLATSLCRTVWPNGGFKASPSSLARVRKMPCDSEGALTPTNSPQMASSIVQESNTPIASRGVPPPTSPPLSLSSSGFGGTGSTVVNTKFKDHVFSTLLRRLSKQSCGRNSAGTRVEDDGDIADGEGDDVAMNEGMANVRRKKKLSRVERLREEEATILGQPLRRVQSENGLLSQEKCSELGDQNSDPSDLFEFEYDHPMEKEAMLKFKDQKGTSAFTTRSHVRSRSRSQPSRSIPRGLVEPHHPHGHRSLSVENRERDPSVTRQNHFILMEDLTGRLKHSCVLDLKMGTRQYGMDATPAKKKSQRKKCDRTTSRLLGARVCGMQVSGHA
ncbi:hypothetical protein AcV7_008290 [Taiwanofungus camphoratus]|nr:hypothetical protein AcV7_008290 [Antrodia cinnamomea]